MQDAKEDLLTVANAAFDIRSDKAAYGPRTRGDAWSLWCLALERLRSQELSVAPGLEPASDARTPVASFD
jgi:hypothetical protein